MDNELECLLGILHTVFGQSTLHRDQSTQPFGHRHIPTFAHQNHKGPVFVGIVIHARWHLRLAAGDVNACRSDDPLEQVALDNGAYGLADLETVTLDHSGFCRGSGS